MNVKKYSDLFTNKINDRSKSVLLQKKIGGYRESFSHLKRNTHFENNDKNFTHMIS